MRHLGDPRFSDLTVSEIAWRCGFTDSSHFARRFAQRYGILHRAHRRVALPGAPEESPRD